MASDPVREDTLHRFHVVAILRVYAEFVTPVSSEEDLAGARQPIELHGLIDYLLGPLPGLALHGDAVLKVL